MKTIVQNKSLEEKQKTYKEKRSSDKDYQLYNRELRESYNC